ncbi:P-type DNA transfer ATPase VirB11 [Caballeronia sordidicola]|uniref:P-type DNA transfer ATPase VirB11 n=1 Tax=Caballeronia sordidicola TaxID=196367 RepID=UPI00094C48D4|nr:P-type DNA transfer ATPase VirB11 [Caballeronia sordidicola]
MTGETSTLELHLEPLQRFLNDRTVNEICINRPGEVWTECSGKWAKYEVPEITATWCTDAGRLTKNHSSQDMNVEHPMMGATLPGGERIQIVMPPIVEHTSITIRVPSAESMSFEKIMATGSFENTRCEQSVRLTSGERAELESTLPPHEKKLLELFRAKAWSDFLRMAVLYRQNVLLSGQTGSGKTTLGNALSEMIPASERLITIEDAREMRMSQLNQVNMVYSRDGQGLAKTTPKQMMEGTLRMRPDRVLPAELRGDEAFFFIQNVLNSGHPGTITTLHANSSKLAFKRLLLMIQASPEGRGLAPEIILETLYSLIHVVIQSEKEPETGRKVVTEIYYDPAFSRKQMG